MNSYLLLGFKGVIIIQLHQPSLGYPRCPVAECLQRIIIEMKQIKIAVVVKLYGATTSISRHLREDHGLSFLSSAVQELNFKILKHCNNKFDCLIFEMLYIKHLQPDLNIQSDSIKAKLFT